ncbi:MAG: TatD family hydrolase [Christensenellaceae bacterium]|jgi:TatD DNase family protein|nr:TatD family hydrolase [Christensenellaceae bacterium]
MLFDTHAHLSDARFAEDLPDVLRRAREDGVGKMLTIGTSLEDSARALEIARNQPDIWATAGIHPHEASSSSAETLGGIRSLAADPKVRAIGEIGLDYHYDLSPREVQRSAFSTQLELAGELKLPVVLHIREAHGDALAILRGLKRKIAGVVHCYSGSIESAREYMALGLHISFTGSVTFKNAQRLAVVAGEIPLERLLVETDCPYMAPVPLRGKRNEPANVALVAAFLAELRGLPTEALAEAATANAEALFSV